MDIKFKPKNKKYTEFMAAPVNNSELTITGCLTGLSHYLGIKPAVTKIAFILLSIFSTYFIGIIAYLILFYFTPKYNSKNDLTFTDTTNIKSENKDFIIKKENKKEEVVEVVENINQK